MMLTLEVAGILGLIGIRDVRRVFLWLVEYLTLAGPCPFLLVLVSHCPGWARFFEILVFISLLSSNNNDKVHRSALAFLSLESSWNDGIADVGCPRPVEAEDTW